MAHEVTLIPGDGTGPELIDATRRVLEATGVEFEWDEHPAGEDVYEEEGTPFPERTLDSVKRTIEFEDRVIDKRDDPSAVGTSELADAVIEEMN
jgi:hypothetical protein